VAAASAAVTATHKVITRRMAGTPVKAPRTMAFNKSLIGTLIEATTVGTMVEYNRIIVQDGMAVKKTEPFTPTVAFLKQLSLPNLNINNFEVTDKALQFMAHL
jgi:hypothetical protein